METQIYHQVSGENPFLFVRFFFFGKIDIFHFTIKAKEMENKI